MDSLIALTRMTQYAGAAVLFGTPLLLVYGFAGARREAHAALRPIVAGAAGLLAVAASVYLCAQIASMAGDPAAAFDPDTLQGVLAESAMGWAVGARILAALAALVLALAPGGGRGRNILTSGLGVVALLSFAWTGHGAADEGPDGAVHLAADLLHLLAAGAWVGALVGFAWLLRPQNRSRAALKALHHALAGFSGVGSAIVAIVVASGVVNSWFLVGPRYVADLVRTPYGWMLTAKLGLFAGMLLLAARNRFAHTPALRRALDGSPFAPSVDALRASVLFETALAFAVLALVGVLGMLAPISSQ